MTTRPPSKHAHAIWQLVAQGKSYKVIARQLGIAEHTVKNVLAGVAKRNSARNDRVVLALLFHGIRV